jgi:hypothetical protein
MRKSTHTRCIAGVLWLKYFSTVLHHTHVLTYPVWNVCMIVDKVILLNTARSESRCALSIRYVDLVVSTEVTVAVCCCFTVFSC